MITCWNDSVWIIELKCIIKTRFTCLFVASFNEATDKFKLTYVVSVHSTVALPLSGVFVSEEPLGKESGAV